MKKAALSNKNALKRAPGKLEEFISSLSHRKVASVGEAGTYASILTSRLTEVQDHYGSHPHRRRRFKVSNPIVTIRPVCDVYH